MILATDRQKKVLNFYGIKLSSNATQGKAGAEIDKIKKDPTKWIEWKKYCFYTNDFNDGNDQLKEFDRDKLKNIVIPDNWDLEKQKQKYIEEKVKILLKNEVDHSPFDNPQPNIEFKGRKFVLSGKFASCDSKSKCESEIKKHGGTISSSVSSKTDYLILGGEGSPDYKHDTYGSKVVKAMNLRSNYGIPAIISEEHWVSQQRGIIDE